MSETDKCFSKEPPFYALIFKTLAICLFAFPAGFIAFGAPEYLSAEKWTMFSGPGKNICIVELFSLDQNQRVSKVDDAIILNFSDPERDKDHFFYKTRTLLKTPSEVESFLKKVCANSSREIHAKIKCYDDQAWKEELPQDRNVCEDSRI